MPYTISWYEPRRIILIELVGVITTDDLEKITEESFAKVLESDQRVHALVDQTNLKSAPMNLRSMKQFVSPNHADNQGMTVFVATDTNPVVRFLATTVFQIFGWEYRIAKTLDEAITILQKVDTELKINTNDTIKMDKSDLK